MAKQRSGYIADHLNKLSEQLLDMRPAVDAYITPDQVARYLTAIADTPAPSTAARLDGMSKMAIINRVIVPNAWPAVMALAIFSVVAHWNELFWPLIVISCTERAPPPLGLLFFRAAEASDDYGALMAATLVITLPLVVAFLVAQRRFIEGITLTGLKG